MEQQRVSVRDGRFQVRVFSAGSGRPLVFLHGPAGLRLPLPFLDQLAGQFAVYAPEMPGFGESTGLEHLDDVIDLAIYHLDLLDALGLEQPILAGHSLGGMVAAEMAALFPTRIRKLVEIAPTGFWLDDHPVPDFFSVTPAELPPLLWHDPEGSLAQEWHAVPEDRAAAREATILALQNAAAAAKFLWPLPDKGLKKRIHRIKAPTLLVWGASDKLIDPVYAKLWLEKISGSRLVTLPEAGHMVLVERPDALVSAIAEFTNE